MKEKTFDLGFTDAALKWVALTLMVLDHIRYFFEYTGRVPEWFSMLGRLSAPLFLFCVVEGFTHTHNKKRYFLRIYAFAIGMGLVQYLMITTGRTRADGFYPQNQMLATFSVLLMVLQGMEWCKSKQWGKGLSVCLIPLLWPVAAIILQILIPAARPWIVFLHYTILPMHVAIIDGGTFIVVLGILLYFLKGRYHCQAIVCAAGYFLYYGLLLYINGIGLGQLMTQYYEWMGGFAAILIWMYNGRKGRGSRKLFYWFYPAHVYILYGLSCLLF